MKNINVNVIHPPTNIPLGRYGENLATCVSFDCTGLVQLYGDGTAELLHELKSGTVYPVAIKQDGTSVSWIVTASDTATVGAGRAELRWYVGDTLAKSAKFRTSVSSALADSTTETPPEPQQSWVDAVLQAAQEIKDGAISDEQVRDAVDSYVNEHGLATGATTEQAAQIEQNTADISSLSEENAELKGDLNQLENKINNFLHGGTSGGGGVTSAFISALQELFSAVAVWDDTKISNPYAKIASLSAFASSDSGGGTEEGGSAEITTSFFNGVLTLNGVKAISNATFFNGKLQLV